MISIRLEGNQEEVEIAIEEFKAVFGEKVTLSQAKRGKRNYLSYGYYITDQDIANIQLQAQQKRQGLAQLSDQTSPSPRRQRRKI